MSNRPSSFKDEVSPGFAGLNNEQRKANTSSYVDAIFFTNEAQLL